MRLLIILFITSLLLVSCQSKSNTENSEYQTIIAQSFENSPVECTPVNLEELKKIELAAESKEDLMQALR